MLGVSPVCSPAFHNLKILMKHSIRILNEIWKILMGVFPEKYSLKIQQGLHLAEGTFQGLFNEFTIDF